MKPKSLIRNYIFNLLKTISSIVFPIVTFAYSSRILGAEGIGKVNFSKSIVLYFAMIAMLGINQYGTREAAKVRDNRAKLSKFVHEVMIINFITTCLAYVLLFLSICFIGKLQNYTTLIWINSIAIFMQGLGMEWLYQAMEEYAYIAKRAIVFQVISFVLLVIFVRNANDLYWYAVITVLSSSGSYMLNFINARKYVDLKRFSRYEIKEHLPGMLWLFAMAVSIELYTVLDSTMLGFFCDDTAVGLYTVAIRVNRLTNTVITALGVVLIPRLSYYIGQRETDKANDLICKGYNYVFMMSIPAAIGLFCLSDGIIDLLSGADYASAALTMKVMTPIVVVIPFSVMTNNQTFVPMEKEKLILISTCLGAVSNFIANFILIPKYAENGAAIGTVIAESVVAIVCLINSIRLLDMKRVFKEYYQYWIAAIPIFAIAYFIKMIQVNYILQMALVIVFSVIEYSLVLYLFKNQYFVSITNKVTSKLARRG